MNSELLKKNNCQLSIINYFKNCIFANQIKTDIKMAITKHTNAAPADTDCKNFLANGWHLSVTYPPADYQAVTVFSLGNVSFVERWRKLYAHATKFPCLCSKISMPIARNFYAHATKTQWALRRISIKREICL